MQRMEWLKGDGAYIEAVGLGGQGLKALPEGEKCPQALEFSLHVR